MTATKNVIENAVQQGKVANSFHQSLYAKPCWKGCGVVGECSKATMNDDKTNKMALALIASGGRPPWTEGIGHNWK